MLSPRACAHEHSRSMEDWIAVAVLERAARHLPELATPTSSLGSRLPGSLAAAQQPSRGQGGCAPSHVAVPVQRKPSGGVPAAASRWAFRLILLLLGTCLALSLLVGTYVGRTPTPQGWGQYTWQEEGFSDPQLLVEELREHVRRHGPAEDFYPAGCRWRTVGELPRTDLASNRTAAKLSWSIQQHEYWDAASQQWVAEQPAECRLQTLALHDWQAGAWQQQQHSDAAQHTQQEQQQPWPWGGPASGGDCDEEGYCRYSNVWFNEGRFYFLAEGAHPVQGNWPMSKSRLMEVLNVQNATQWAQSVNARVVPGDTVAVDFIFFLHPTAIGHWLESMFPLFSALLHEPAFKRTPDRLLLLYQKRGFIFPWVRALMALALGVKPGDPLPPLILQQEHDDPWEQYLLPPEGVRRSEWVCFEKMLWVKDIFVNGTRSFRDRQDAQLFRRLMYEQYGIPFPAPGTPPPPVVTFQRKSTNRRVLNEAELLDMLREFGEVRVVEFSGSTPFREQLATMAGTGVYVSVHTSNLANTPFLPPGAAVFEIIQKNWAWADIDQSFAALTRQMGDIHHYAWRAQKPNQTLYHLPRHAQLFSSWNASQCVTEECVEAHTLVDVVADVEALRRLIAGRLRRIRVGASVAQARLPWPLAT